jgi:site-specific DNA-methyltransferase (adenine-specific)
MSAHIIVGDCIAAMARLPEMLIDAVVTDPPYHLQSISKRFANSPRSEKTERYAAGPYGRHAAGFMGKKWDGGDIAMDSATWVAVLRLLKPGGHMLTFGGTRTHHRVWTAIENAGFEIRDTVYWVYGSGFPKSHDAGNGWGTALKPAIEPIVLARRPLIGTVAENTARYGTGAINVDGCRVAPTGGAQGRWPANLVHDGGEEVLAAFPNAVGQQGYVGPEHGDRLSKGIYGDFGPRPPSPPRGDGGSAARFFYCAKASRTDRDEGVEGPEKPPLWSSGTQSPGTFQSAGTKKSAKNNHPTVKPTELMRWLCRLVTPSGGLILDPFMGSGSTGKAALREGFRFLGIEKEAPYAEIARQRIGGAKVYELMAKEAAE